MSRRTIATLLAVGLTLAACGTAAVGPTTTTIAATSRPTTTPPTSAPGDVTLTLMAHDAFASAVTDQTFAPFTAATGVEVNVLSSGDVGTMVGQAVLTKDNPVADVMFGVDDTFLGKTLDAGIFEPYTSSLLDRVNPDFVLDPEHRVTPIDYGDVCVNYDKTVFSGELPRPLNLEQLANQEYAGQLVVEDPNTSSPGLAFLLATVAAFGPNGWQDYWRRLVANDVLVVPDWDTAYYSSFTRYGGDRPLVVSYASSPPAEVIFADPPITEAPTGVIDEGCYRQIEFAGVMTGTEHPEAAGKLIDYLLSVDFQDTVPLNWFVYPVNDQATLPDVFVQNTTVPAAPLRMSPQEIDANRATWIEEWTQIVLP